LQISRRKRISNKLSIFSGELIAIMMALRWIYKAGLKDVVTCSKTIALPLYALKHNSQALYRT